MVATGELHARRSPPARARPALPARPRPLQRRPRDCVAHTLRRGTRCPASAFALHAKHALPDAELNDLLDLSSLETPVKSLRAAAPAPQPHERSPAPAAAVEQSPTAAHTANQPPPTANNCSHCPQCTDNRLTTAVTTAHPTHAQSQHVRKASPQTAMPTQRPPRLPVARGTGRATLSASILVSPIRLSSEACTERA